MFKTLFDAYRKRSVYNATRNELNRLSNRELLDLGLHRFEIEKIAR